MRTVRKSCYHEALSSGVGPEVTNQSLHIPEHSGLAWFVPQSTVLCFPHVQGQRGICRQFLNKRKNERLRVESKNPLLAVVLDSLSTGLTGAYLCP